MNRSLYLSLVLCVLFIRVGFTQPPSGYYDNAQGKSGEQLRTALHNIIDGHNAQTYSSLWNHFQALDDKGGSVVWDIYSDVPNGSPAYTFTFGNDQCGNYQGEGDCYNREHSFPSSWFNDGAPMYTDLFMVYPTDGYVNSMRGNLPYGETSNPTWTSTNGSKKGNSSLSTYSGTVFEPIDAYKGDLARSYFYMVTRYKDRVNNWASDMISGDNLTTWAVNMLIQWHDQDPVSQKELDRNNGIFQIQDNRNPYIDHPEWVKEVWWNINSVSEHGSKARGYVYFSDGTIVGEIEGNSASKDLRLEIRDLRGKLVAEEKVQGRSFKEPFEGKGGVYFVRILNGQGKGVFQRKVVIPY